MSVAEDEVMVDDKEVNTDQLSPEELQRLVDNNRELNDPDASNIDHEARDSHDENNQEIKENSARKDLIEELNEKDKIFELLVKSNNELKKKIEMSTVKYNEILNKIKEKENEQTEAKLSHQLNEMDKEIVAYNTQTEHYKKLIDQLKNKIEFKSNLERAFNLQNILKQETMRNTELKNQLNAIMRVNGVQMKYINNYDKENQITEKLDILKSEIKQTKESLKDYMERFAKQDKFIRMIHEKILSLEMMMKKLKEPKIEKGKLFTKEELKETLEIITQLKNQIKDNRNQLNSITKTNDDKIHQLLSHNKQIEIDYKENEKLNKMLIFKKNELKRNLKNSNCNVNALGKASKKPNQLLMIDKKKDQIDCGNKPPTTQKLFSKNPNKTKQNEQDQLDIMENEQKFENEHKSIHNLNQEGDMSENENNFDVNDSNDPNNQAQPLEYD